MVMDQLPLCGDGPVRSGDEPVISVPYVFYMPEGMGYEAPVKH